MHEMETPTRTSAHDVGVVLIGRNEGQRLIDCMSSIGELAARSVYVDSGSTDGSIEAARKMGLTVVELASDIPFTAARARNEGFAALLQIAPDVEFVQFVDGDCRIVDGWIMKARNFFRDKQQVAIVCGRRREIFPDVSIYNRICDDEWNTPVGETEACGGDCLIRVKAFREVNGYAADLIAGEEPEMCLRMREIGWTIWRIDADMTLHDANIRHFSQWWRRSVRAGHAYAQVAARHRTSDKRIWVRNVRRSLFWGGALPAVAVIGGAVVHPAFLAILALYPLQILRLAKKAGPEDQNRWTEAFLSVVGKFAEMRGAVTYYSNVLTSRRHRLIEYK
jgi:GT2 family glycosyltransferase